MRLLSFALFMLSLSAHATDFYIDPSRTAGCPGAGNQQNPFCSWEAITDFKGGDRYFQKRGTTYTNNLTILGGQTATPQNPIYIGAYGAGANPTIKIENTLPSWNVPTKWAKETTKIWRYDTTGFVIAEPQVLLLNGRQAFGKARVKADLCRAYAAQTVEWYYEKNKLYLCSPAGNPASVFSSITGMMVPTGKNWTGIQIENKHDIIIDGYTIRGGWYGAVNIVSGSSNIEIKNSTLGFYSANGVRVSGADGKMNSGIKIHDNVIDSGIRWGIVGYEPFVSGEGVLFVSGVVDSEIYNNTIVAWAHNGVYLLANTTNTLSVKNNIIRDNEFHCGNGSSYFDYCRPFGIDGGKDGDAQYNTFYRNKMHDFSVRAQVNGDHNVIVGNLCFNVINSKAKGSATGQCFSLQPYGVSNNNVLANNTIYNTADVGIEIVNGPNGVSRDHKVLNNIIYSCALTATNGRKAACLFIENHASVGPQVIKNNLIYNKSTAAKVYYRSNGLVTPAVFNTKTKDSIAQNVNADPKLINPVRLDFTLQTGSPAIGLGAAYGSPGLVSTNGAVDLGAFPSKLVNAVNVDLIPGQ